MWDVKCTVCELVDMTCFASFWMQRSHVMWFFFPRHFTDDTGLMHFSAFFTLQMTWEFAFFGYVRQLSCHLQVLYIYIYIFVWWWLSPTPLKNIWVKVSWDDDIPNWMENHIKCSKPPTRSNQFVVISKPQQLLVAWLSWYLADWSSRYVDHWPGWCCLQERSFRQPVSLSFMTRMMLLLLMVIYYHTNRIQIAMI